MLKGVSYIVPIYSYNILRQECREFVVRSTGVEETEKNSSTKQKYTYTPYIPVFSLETEQRGRGWGEGGRQAPHIAILLS